MAGDHKYARLVALLASMFVSLVAGTPYLYGVYSPQLVQRVGLSTSDAATISVAVNLGSGLGGLPAGLLIDWAGPQIAIMLGSLCIFLGYFALNKIYVHATSSLPLICFLMALMGFGSVTSFFSCLKAAQANFPNHRGSAGAIPVGAYGLAATLFSIVAAKFFGGNAGGLLAFLAYLCGSVAFMGSWFVHVYAGSAPEQTGAGALTHIRRPDSLRGSFLFWGVGRRNSRSSFAQSPADIAPLVNQLRAQDLLRKDSAGSFANLSVLTSEASSLSETGVAVPSSRPGEPVAPGTLDNKHADSKPPVTIKSLLCNKTYLSHFLIVTLCSGVCQMYIYTVGFIVRAQFTFNGHEGSAAGMQAIQVSTISIASFGGRVASGMISDYIYKNWRAQRQWVILGTILLTFIGQLFLVLTNSIHGITFVSLCVGGAYGILNGSYPAIIADEFGTKSFTTAWGLVNSGPLFLLFTLEKYFGYIYDGHSDDDGVCHVGNLCYRGAFETSSVLCVLTAIFTGLMMYHKRRK
ncbi:hypothetical protein HF325_000804 [Metschnikowia pulcherrima]|uniref:Nodulin-like domain-containing protein n=1 Tax=Metschnikowia pulcherrima TaxID=27326 RepID=A0A8H7GZ22_9ASCO|nr:hypothetical protein HF325_000804 [Metschnikowia pulcherrima]